MSLLWNHVLRGLIHGHRGNTDDAVLEHEAAVAFAVKHPKVLEHAHGRDALDAAKSGLRIQRRVGDAPSIVEVNRMVVEAEEAGDHAGVLRLEGSLEELLDSQACAPPES